MPEGLQIIKVILPTDVKNVEIVPIGDGHLGESECDISLLRDVVEYVRAEPNRYAIINGDMINNAIKTAVSDVYGENDPEDEIRKVANLLFPIKEKILAMGSGNHEERTLKLTGIDPSRYISVRLGIEDRYASNSFLLFLKMGLSHTSKNSNRDKQLVYKIFVQHGYGGGKKNGSKLNNLNASDGIVADADLYIMGHTHTPILNAMSTFLCDVQNMQAYRHTKYYMMHNAYMDFGGYGLRFGFSPAAKEVTYAILNGQGRKKIKMVMGL